MAQVTVIGAGLMGSAMARRLADRAHAVTLWDHNPAKRAAWDDPRVHFADDPAEAVRRASVVITMLPDGAAVREVASRVAAARRWRGGR
jgi:3-hydroxyisobutyrate dehydrogenase